MKSIPLFAKSGRTTRLVRSHVNRRRPPQGLRFVPPEGALENSPIHVPEMGDFSVFRSFQGPSLNQPAEVPRRRDNRETLCGKFRATVNRQPQSLLCSDPTHSHFTMFSSSKASWHRCRQRRSKHTANACVGVGIVGPTDHCTDRRAPQSLRPQNF